ncbi:Ribosome-associated endonuclease [Prochlorococcus sp. MIT 0601]|nr:Ribosome-associated endonuclease [Prochlorococcus sp. MIT 0601]
MGGTRFVGKALIQKFAEENHDIFIFTRGRNELPGFAEHIKGDRDTDDINKLNGMKFDVIVDSSGRELEQTKRVIHQIGYPNNRLIYISSAGIYSSNYKLPIKEDDMLDPNSRHIGKAKTEQWLKREGIPFTSFRPTYIYGPNNYNPIEKWFFDRIVNFKPIPMPGDGNIITQLGHVEDLAIAINLSISNNKTINECYNISGKKGVTLKGLIYAAAKAANISLDDLDIRSFDYTELEPKARKAFPVRLNHFLTDISKIENHLRWTPSYTLENGLSDSFNNDYAISAATNPDCSLDNSLIGD